MKNVNLDTPAHLLKALREGNRDAYNKVFTTYYEPIRAFLHALTKSQEETEKLTSETFCVLWEKRESIDPYKSIKSLLYATCRNVMYDYFKKTGSMAGNIMDSEAIEWSLIQELNLDHKSLEEN